MEHAPHSFPQTHLSHIHVPLSSRLAPVYNEVAPVFGVFGRLFGKALEVQVGKICDAGCEVVWTVKSSYQMAPRPNPYPPSKGGLCHPRCT